MKDILGINDALIIPNGVDFDLFPIIDKEIAREKLKWESSDKIILFAADPTRREKNFKLAQEALALLDFSFVLISLGNVKYSEMVYYYNASDIILLTSRSEGSPNVIKEAMVCNCPIVSTDVGDVRKVFGNTEGCYITSHDPDDVAEKIRFALEYAQTKCKTNGREHIIKLGLDDVSVANKILEVYEKAMISD